MAFKTVFSCVLLQCAFIAMARSQTLYLTATGFSDRETATIDSLGYQKVFSDYLSLQDETFLIKERLVNLGYIDCELKQLNKSNDSTYTVSFELNTLFKGINIFFIESLPPEVLAPVSRKIDKNHIAIDIRDLESTLKLLNERISEKGHPFATLRLVNVEKSGRDSLRADLDINKRSEKRSVDSVIVKGYEKFPKSYIKRYLKLDAKQVFNLNAIKAKTSKIENLKFATQAKEPEVLFTRDSTLIYIYIEKRPSNTFDGFLGFGTNENTDKIEFNGYLNLNLTNNLNFGESISLQYKSDQSEQKTFDVKTDLPYLFGSPLGLELGLNIFKKDSSFVTVAQSAKINYQINTGHKVALGVDAINSTDLLDSGVLEILDYKSSFYMMDYQFVETNRSSALFPIAFQAQLSGGFGSRSVENTKESQSKFVLVAERIFNLNDTNSIFVKLSGAALLSDSHLENELFRFGGINSIRGFEENSIVANLYSVLNTEYRFQMNSNLYAHTVFDTGYIENSTNGTKDKLFGFGFGFGLLTNAGLLKFNYAAGKINDAVLRLSNSKIHISLTANF